MFWSIEEAAKSLNKKHKNVYYLIREGKIAAFKFGNVYRIAPEDVKNYYEHLTVSDDNLNEIFKRLPAILAVRDLTDIFKVDRKTVTNLIHLKDISTWKDEDGQWCIARSDLLKYCSKRLNLNE